MLLRPIAGRACVRLAGADVLKFLQGLVTNDVMAAAGAGAGAGGAAAAQALPAAFLTNKGRVVCDALLHFVPAAGGGAAAGEEGAGDVVVADVPEVLFDHMMRMLKMHTLRSEVTVEDARGEFRLVHFGGETDDLPTIITDAPSCYLGMDPRFSTLGHRLLLPREVAEDALAGSDGEHDAAYYTALRIAHGVAEGVEVYNHIPLEANMDLLNNINFQKGCYVGQELVARTYFKGVIRKRFVPLLFLPKSGSAGAADAATTMSTYTLGDKADPTVSAFPQLANADVANDVKNAIAEWHTAQQDRSDGASNHAAGGLPERKAAVRLGDKEVGTIVAAQAGLRCAIAHLRLDSLAAHFSAEAGSLAVDGVDPAQFDILPYIPHFMSDVNLATGKPSDVS